MRVLMLSWEYSPHLIGGLGRHVTELAPRLAAAGADVHILTPWLQGGERHEIISPHLQVTRVSVPPMGDDLLISFVEQACQALEREARRLVLAQGPFDLIHGHDWLVAYAGIALKHAWHRPLVSTIHATERGRSHGLIRDHHQRAIDSVDRWLTDESWRVITVSQYMASQLGDFFDLPAEKIDVIYNGTQLPRQPLTPRERRDVRRRYVADDEQLIFSVGRLVYEKGFQILVEAIPRVLAAQPRARFAIAGTGALRQLLERRAHELGLADRFVFLGFISDEERDRLYQVADVAVFPSLYEPFGIVALEAMAARCPVVVSQTGGLQEVVRLHETGIVVYPDNPDSLAWGILHTLQHPTWTAARVENAFRATIEQFNWSNIACQTLQIYERVQAEWRASAWGREALLAPADPA